MATATATASATTATATATATARTLTRATIAALDTPPALAQSPGRLVSAADMGRGTGPSLVGCRWGSAVSAVLVIAPSASPARAVATAIAPSVAAVVTLLA